MNKSLLILFVISLSFLFGIALFFFFQKPNLSLQSLDSFQDTSSQDTQQKEIRVKKSESSNSFSLEEGLPYPIVDTGVTKFYDTGDEIIEPQEGEDFFGQDAHYQI